MTLLAACPSPAAAAELQTAHARILYDGADLLEVFASALKRACPEPPTTPSEPSDPRVDVPAWVDAAVRRARSSLELTAPAPTVQIVLLPAAADVQAAYRETYQRRVTYVAFYSPRSRTVFLSAPDATAAVLTHEVTHALVDDALGSATPPKVHEILAQYVERSIPECSDLDEVAGDPRWPH